VWPEHKSCPRAVFSVAGESSVHATDDTQSPGNGLPAHELTMVRDLAASLLVRDEDIAACMTDRLHAAIPELAESRAGPLMTQTRDTCRANVAQILRALARGEAVEELAVPPEAIACAQSYVQRELPVAVLLRAYQIGQADFLERWTGDMAAQARGDPGLRAALVSSTSWVFAYVDKVCDQIVREYGRARERWARTPEAVRAETARAVLDGTLRDDREASRLLGHELARRHHLAIITWASGSDAGRMDRSLHLLERTASAVAEALGMTEPLIVLPGGSELWAWLSGLGPLETGRRMRLASTDQPPEVRIAAGRIWVGIDGFRKSHIEARAAAAVAVLAGQRAPSVTHYDDVELVSLLSTDLERARAFVAYELDGLAGSSRASERLRETILVLLEEGMSNSRAAQRLHVHSNTIAYRTARAQELLGHRLVDRRIQVAAALMLAQTLGDVVLDSEGSDPG
jgi:DNA-binding CsgD family transcriptional regulator